MTLRSRSHVILSTLMAASLGSAQDLVLNEVLTSNARSAWDDEGEARDWVEIANAGAEAVELEGWSLSDEPEEPRRWVFPSGRLGPGERILVWCSGKNRTYPSREAIEAPGSPVRFEPIHAGRDAAYRYLHGKPGDAGPAPEWSVPDFHETSWLAGAGSLGHGATDLSTVVPEGTGAAFLRMEFQLGSVPTGPLVCRVRYDDGFLLYLNGSLAASANVDLDEPPGFSSRATRFVDSGPERLLDISHAVGLLRPGRNVIAAAVLNVTPSSADLVLSIELGSVAPVLHASFRLDRERGSLILSRPDGSPADRLDLPALGRDRSVGRLPDASGPFGYLAWPTPGIPNEGRAFPEAVPDDLTVFPPAGRYPARFMARVEPWPEAPVDIRFTLDGSRPTLESSPLAGAVPIDRSLVLRVAGFLDGREVFFGRGRSYLTAEPPSLLPLLSVSLSPRDFSALRVLGNGEREGWLEVLDPSGSTLFAEGAGLRAHGRALRAERKKSFRLHFREAYGAGRLRHPLFQGSTDHNAVVLRGHVIDDGQNPSLIADQLVRTFSGKLQEIALRGGWYHLYVNGVHQGLYNAVERLEEELLEARTGEKRWDIVKGGGEVHGGDGAAWQEILRVVQQPGLGEAERADELKRRVDMEDFARFLAVQAWFGNRDLPTNWYAVKPARDGSKWRFVAWDGDIIGDDARVSIARTWTIGPASVLGPLLGDREFQDLLLSTLQSAAWEVLRPEEVIREIEAQRALIEPDIALETATNGGTLASWNAAVDRLVEFCRGRDEAIIREALRSSLLSIPRPLEVVPARAFRREGARFRLLGMGFSADTQVLLDDEKALDVRVLSDTEIEASLPDTASLSTRPFVRTEGSDGFGCTRHGLLELVDEGPGFIRGDVNGDGRLSINDAILVVLTTTGESPAPPLCPSADADASGSLDVADALRIVRYLFLYGPPPPQPFPECGVAPDIATDCESEC